ncbi:venom peptide MmKTx1-like [Drosophila biarmipes]|uniref:venom peptide MmKTx1-like n=1 Tax=Drosophila biarmipes TaxID=125945 RepID=UPI001CDB3766|nr:venom peptide MmKTx1-like [Drosophila biarmipes]
MISLAIGLVLLAFLVPYGHGLVHFVKLQPGESGGCKGVTGNDLKVGETEKDENTCGVYVCQNDKGDSLIHYCQLPATFQECSDEGVSTVLPFPECCWICVEWEDCDAGGGDGGGEGGGEAEGEAK